MAWNPTRVVETGPAVIDSFEDGDISEYSGTPSEYSVVDESNVSFSAIDGSKVLKKAGTDTTNRIYSLNGDGLDNYYARGDGTFVWYTRWVAQDNMGEIRVHFSFIDGSNYYDAAIDPRDGNISVRENYNGYSVLSEDTSASFSVDTWYKHELTWDDGTLGGSDGDITFDVYDTTDDSLVGGVTANSTSLDSDGIGWRPRTNDDPVYIDHAHIQKA